MRNFLSNHELKLKMSGRAGFSKTLRIILPPSSFWITLSEDSPKICHPPNGAEIGLFPGALSPFTWEVSYKVPDSHIGSQKGNVCPWSSPGTEQGALGLSLVGSRLHHWPYESWWSYWASLSCGFLVDGMDNRSAHCVSFWAERHVAKPCGHFCLQLPQLISILDMVGHSVGCLS